MTTPAPQRPRSRVPSLPVLVAGIVVLMLGLIFLIDHLFNRSLRQPIPGVERQEQRAAPAAGTQAPAQAVASTPVAAAAPAPAPASATATASGSASPRTPEAVAVAGDSAAKSFRPPPHESIPAGAFGDMIRLGERIFTQTGKYAPKYVGNSLNCVNCHLDAGRLPGSAPLWSSFVHYPAFRAKTGQVDTLASRLQGCFAYSMNGKAPPADDEVITALQTYAFFLAKGAPVGTPLAGSGYPKLKDPALAPDYARGQQVFTRNCAVCHGEDGQGQRAGGQQVFPPLWGPQSYNWGAGMHQTNNAAAFIHANMPLGKGGSLSEQEAWDVAFFMNAHERPQDPRFTGSVAQTRKKFHDSPYSPYGTVVNGHLLGSAPSAPQAAGNSSPARKPPPSRGAS